MPLVRKGYMVDGRPTHQILAIEERFDSLTIVVGPRRVSIISVFAAVGLLFAGVLLVLAFVVALSNAGAFGVGFRMLHGGLTSIALVGVWCYLVAQVRRHVNHRTITVTEGIVTITTGPIWPTESTLQLAEGDRMRVSRHERRLRRWAWPKVALGSVNEFGVDVWGTRMKNDWDVEIIPPFSISHREAEKLSEVMNKFARLGEKDVLVGSRL